MRKWGGSLPYLLHLVHWFLPPCRGPTVASPLLLIAAATFPGLAADAAVFVGAEFYPPAAFAVAPSTIPVGYPSGKK